MITILSPSKRMEVLSQVLPMFMMEQYGAMMSDPLFRREAWQIAKKMKGYSPEELSRLLRVNPQLSMTTAERFASFRLDPLDFAVRPAILAFQGDVYKGLEADTMDREDHLFAQEHLFILSALYGFLRPLDKIQAYRLEMGIPLQVGRHKNLYAFWKEKITRRIKDMLSLQRTPVLINLASMEYSSVIDMNALKARIITIVFKELRNGAYRILSTHAKYARGRMARYIIDNRIDDPEALKHFDLDGYGYDANLSDDERWVFTR